MNRNIPGKFLLSGSLSPRKRPLPSSITNKLDEKFDSSWSGESIYMRSLEGQRGVKTARKCRALDGIVQPPPTHTHTRRRSFLSIEGIVGTYDETRQKQGRCQY